LHVLTWFKKLIAWQHWLLHNGICKEPAYKYFTKNDTVLQYILSRKKTGTYLLYWQYCNRPSLRLQTTFPVFLRTAISDPSSVDRNSTESWGTSAVFYNQYTLKREVWAYEHILSNSNIVASKPKSYALLSRQIHLSF